MHRSRLPAIALASACTLLSSACGPAVGDDEGGGGRDRPEAGAERGSTAAREAPRVRLVEVGRFEAPVHALGVPGTDLVAVVEKGGRVLVASGMQCSTPARCPKRPVEGGDVVVDLRGEVSTGSEQGLLGLAFHPRWPDDPRIYLNYTDLRGDTRVEAWSLAAPTSHARRVRELIRIPQPYPNHNGGHLAFGPDGLLYVGSGDGGAAGDPGDRAQQPDELLGKLLRVDVDGDGDGERGYAIPDGNVDDGAPEAWAVGLRNPWRFSFDRDSGDLWLGDVGQDDREEIDALPAARLREGPTPNFGWRRFEGFAEFDTSGVQGPGRIVEPVLDYGRDHGCSVTGGVVYRGSMVPRLAGWYLFADFCGSDLRLLRAKGVPGSTREPGELRWSSVEGVEQVASFGEIARGELLVVSLSGSIHQVMPR